MFEGAGGGGANVRLLVQRLHEGVLPDIQVGYDECVAQV